MSLKEQMLKAGLITEQQAKEATHTKKVADKRTGGGEKAAQAEAARREAQREADRQRARDRERNKAEHAAKEEKGRQAGAVHRQRETATKALQQGEFSRWEGTRTYYFQHGTRVEILKVTDEAARRLEGGQAAIVLRPGKGRGYMVLQGAAAQKLLEADAARVIVFHREPGQHPPRAEKPGGQPARGEPGKGAQTATEPQGTEQKPAEPPGKEAPGKGVQTATGPQGPEAQPAEPAGKEEPGTEGPGKGAPGEGPQTATAPQGPEEQPAEPAGKEEPGKEKGNPHG